MGSPNKKDGRRVSRTGGPRMARPAAYLGGPDGYSARQPAFRLLLRSARCRTGKRIEDVLKDYPSTGLLFIDTLQMVRDNVSAKVNAYAQDYRICPLLRRSRTTTASVSSSYTTPARNGMAAISSMI